MKKNNFDYIIIGTGLAGISAIDGIRERDKKGSILLVGKEKHLPYDRPPLSKALWSGKQTYESIFLRDTKFYADNKVELTPGKTIVNLNPDEKIIQASSGDRYHYRKLLLATGGVPRTLTIPDADLEDICYFRYLDDYITIKNKARQDTTVTIVGGGFIGSELAAALAMNKVKVTMIFPESYLIQRIFPEYLGKAIQQYYIQRGITILSEDLPVSFEKKRNKLITRIKNGKEIFSEIIIVGAGIVPSVELAKMAELKIENGISVDSYLRTSDPHIYAAGDNAYFPYLALGQNMRIEHWDNSLNQGKYAGLNMAGAKKRYDYMPFFYSDLFEFGYEAVGEVNSQLETFADWKKENDTGVIYYLKNGIIRGVMMCNVWDKVKTARTLIKSGKKRTLKQLKGLIA